VDEMDLAEIGLGWIFGDSTAVFHRDAAVSVPDDSFPRDELD
jgi:hypothetical protein